MGELLTNHHGVEVEVVESMEMASGVNPRPGRVLARAPEPSQSRVDDDDGDITFHGCLIGYLGFSDEDVFMGRRLTSGEACGPHTTSRRAGGGTRATRWCGGSTAPSVSPSISVYVTGIYDGGFSSRAIPRIFPV